jgi:hypothetical protein
MKIEILIAVVVLLLQWTITAEMFQGMVQKWMLGPLFGLHAQGRLKRLERLQARKALLMELNASTDKQIVYLLQSVLIVLVCVAGLVAMGVNIHTGFPRLFAGYVGVAAFIIYFVALFKLGTHRRAYVPVAFKKAIEEIDAQIAALKASGGHAAM